MSMAAFLDYLSICLCAEPGLRVLLLLKAGTVNASMAPAVCGEVQLVFSQGTVVS